MNFKNKKQDKFFLNFLNNLILFNLIIIKWFINIILSLNLLKIKIL